MIRLLSKVLSGSILLFLYKRRQAMQLKLCAQLDGHRKKESEAIDNQNKITSPPPHKYIVRPSVYLPVSPSGKHITDMLSILFLFFNVK